MKLVYLIYILINTDFKQIDTDRISVAQYASKSVGQYVGREI